jgi:DNA-binding NarL/FixJ family response regulator
MRVLIVDDSLHFRRSLRETLGRALAGAAFGEAGTGAEGLSLLQSQDWDVVLLDLSLPDGGGLGAVAEFRRLRPALPLVVMSLHPAGQYAAAVAAAGATGYLSKSSDPPAIVAAVQGATGSGRVLPERPPAGPQARPQTTTGGPALAGPGDLSAELDGPQLSRMLHDDLAQLLTAMKINLRLAAASDDLEDMRARALDVVGLVDQAIGSVRRLLSRLTPPSIDGADRPSEQA